MNALTGVQGAIVCATGTLRIGRSAAHTVKKSKGQKSMSM